MAGQDEDAALAELREKIAAAQRAREERSAANAKSGQLASLEQQLADELAINAAEEKYGEGKFAVHHTPMGAVIIRRPVHMHYRRLMDTKDVKFDDAMKLVLTCLVHPPRASFEAIAEELPAVPILVASKAMDLAAGRKVELEGK